MNKGAVQLLCFLAVYCRPASHRISEPDPENSTGIGTRSRKLDRFRNETTENRELQFFLPTTLAALLNFVRFIAKNHIFGMYFNLSIPFRQDGMAVANQS